MQKTQKKSNKRGLEDADTFLLELSKMLQYAREGTNTGSLVVSMKRAPIEEKKDSKRKRKHVEADVCCLVRANFGKRRKVSTRVLNKDHKFPDHYNKIIRAFDGLVKRTKKKKVKTT